MAARRTPMKICVLGVWHLGSVTAACLATMAHQVIGVDFDNSTVEDLNRGVAPVFEPELEALLKQGIASGSLRFTSALEEATADADILWVTFDTPIDDHDQADSQWVIAQIERALVGLRADAVVLISSQLAAGSVRRLEQLARRNSGSRLRIAYCPENLRLGRAVADFLHPERIVVGLRSALDREVLGALLHPITASIEWMTVESAEMTKHALNAFLAMSIVFANETATICEALGADAKQVERGLKTDRRIGPGAYLSPGAAFAGGTLARDVTFLNAISQQTGVTTPLLAAVIPSNELHKRWAQLKLQALFADLSHTTVAVWGLTYKPGTDTLRRSAAVELGEWLLRQGAAVHVHDPMAKELPRHWRGAVTRYEDPLIAVRGAHALVMCTEWPLYRAISADQLAGCAEGVAVLDANRFLPNLAGSSAHLRYFAVGMPLKG
jgi:UDPglucose 6-dehydrogenase